ncbi:MAG: radical SAM protein [Clostridiales bacterium GWF2_38_85]|nr:MAG: radical SAM protein [Clostridiales bacterium GWF2_38_85]
MKTIPAKTIVSSYTECGWFGSNYNMNIYKGCCHGCIYCDSRSECYQIDNFDEVRAKENALEIIEKDLRSKRKKGIIITGSMSDPYNPFEREYELTRGALKLIDMYNFGVVIDTKSDLVLRDIDILQNIKSHSPAVVNFTVTTADNVLCKQIERNVCTSSKRFEAIKKLTDSGISCGVLLMPILPFINDTEENIHDIVQKSAESGARWIYSGGNFGVTLRINQREYFYQMLDEHFPGIKNNYVNLFGDSYLCISPKNEKLNKLFVSECRKYRLLYRMENILEEIRKEFVENQIKF